MRGGNGGKLDVGRGDDRAFAFVADDHRGKPQEFMADALFEQVGDEVGGAGAFFGGHDDLDGHVVERVRHIGAGVLVVFEGRTGIVDLLGEHRGGAVPAVLGSDNEVEDRTNPLHADIFGELQPLVDFADGGVGGVLDGDGSGSEAEDPLAGFGSEDR